jgi:hypothetical protein
MDEQQFYEQIGSEPIKTTPFKFAAFVAIGLGGISFPLFGGALVGGVLLAVPFFFMLAPFWIPAFFAGLAFGRMRLTWPMIAAFAIAELMGIVIWMFRLPS